MPIWIGVCWSLRIRITDVITSRVKIRLGNGISHNHNCDWSRSNLDQIMMIDHNLISIRLESVRSTVSLGLEPGTKRTRWFPTSQYKVLNVRLPRSSKLPRQWHTQTSETFKGIFLKEFFKLLGKSLKLLSGTWVLSPSGPLHSSTSSLLPGRFFPPLVLCGGAGLWFVTG